MNKYKYKKRFFVFNASYLTISREQLGNTTFILKLKKKKMKAQIDNVPNILCLFFYFPVAYF